jgi:ABC-type tungstate transport system permease subunit
MRFSLDFRLLLLGSVLLAAPGFMQNGFGSGRREVMYNDFVVVGPKDDPAKIDATHDAVAALRKIAAAKARFVARGDLSGTEAAEERLWARPAIARWPLATSGM